MNHRSNTYKAHTGSNLIGALLVAALLIVLIVMVAGAVSDAARPVARCLDAAAACAP